MPNILIFEPDTTGHRMVFVRYLLRAIARQDHLRALLITSRKSKANPSVVSLANDFSSFLSVGAIEYPVRKWEILHSIHPLIEKQVSSFNLLQNLISDLAQSNKIDYIFIPFLDDYCLYPLAFHPNPFHGIPWGGIVIRPRFHLRCVGAHIPQRAWDTVEGIAYRRLMRRKNLDHIFSIDPYLNNHINNKKIVAVPDPSDMISLFPKEPYYGLPSEAVVLLVYGYLDHRKAIDRLLPAMADLRVPQSLTLLLAGAQSPKFASVMRGEIAEQLRVKGRLVELNRHITDDEEAALFQRADIVWSYYPGSYCSSGALVRAGQSSRPVLTTREGLSGLIVNKLGMGLSVGEQDDEGLVAALVRLARDPRFRRELGKSGFNHFSKSTAEIFGRLIVDKLVMAVAGR